ncbi:MAG: transposase [Pseudomonadota bacterium]
MPNYRRARAEDAAWFLTLALEDCGTALLVERVGVLRCAMAETARARPFRLEAAVVLPDHLHLVMRLPEGDGDFSGRVAAMKAQFTRGMRAVGWNPTLPISASKARKGEAGLWQRRFWEHLIRDEADWRAHVAYCWANPVKHGFVARPTDWPYSSIHRDIRRGIVPPEWR